MDEVTREKVLDEFRKLCAEAFHYASQSVYRDLMRMDTDVHRRYEALNIYLTEADSTDRTLKIARYAAEHMLYHIFVMIEESAIFDIVAKVEGNGLQSVPEISDLFAQESMIGLENYAEHGCAMTQIFNLQAELNKRK